MYRRSRRERAGKGDTYSNKVKILHVLAALDRLTDPVVRVRVQVFRKTRACHSSLGEGGSRSLGLATTCPAALVRRRPGTVTVAFVHEAMMDVAGPVSVGAFGAVGLMLHFRRTYTTSLAVRLSWAVSDAVSVRGALLLGMPHLVVSAKHEGVCVRVALSIAWRAWLWHGRGSRWLHPALNDIVMLDAFGSLGTHG